MSIDNAHCVNSGVQHVHCGLWYSTEDVVRSVDNVFLAEIVTFFGRSHDNLIICFAP